MAGHSWVAAAGASPTGGARRSRWFDRDVVGGRKNRFADAAPCCCGTGLDNKPTRRVHGNHVEGLAKKTHSTHRPGMNVGAERDGIVHRLGGVPLDKAISCGHEWAVLIHPQALYELKARGRGRGLVTQFIRDGLAIASSANERHHLLKEQRPPTGESLEYLYRTLLAERLLVRIEAPLPEFGRVQSAKWHDAYVRG